MASANRASQPLSRVLPPILVGALLLFGQVCALKGGVACATPSAAHDAHAEAHCADHDDDCDVPHGCDDCPAGDCAHSNVCCSTWAPAPATVTLAAPALALLPAAVIAPAMDAAGVRSARPVPIPAESPPPRLPILRL